MQPGIWLEIRMEPLANPRPALFLDRDGIIIRDVGYLSDPAEVVLVPEAAALIMAAQAAEVPVLVVTNQSGIDRGLFGWDDFAAVEDRIAQLLAAAGTATDATAACPFHPNHTAGYDETLALWRKPREGMITALADRLNIDLPGSWMIGDNLRDIEAARSASLAGGILVGDLSHPDKLPVTDQADFTSYAVPSIDDALAILKATAFFDSA